MVFPWLSPLSPSPPRLPRLASLPRRCAAGTVASRFAQRGARSVAGPWPGEARNLRPRGGAVKIGKIPGIETGIYGIYIYMYMYTYTYMYMYMYMYVCIYWLVVYLPHLKNISQLGGLFPIYGKIKNVPKHQIAYGWEL